MTNILEYITNLLKEIDLDAFFVFKPDGIVLTDYLTFNFKIYSDWYSDDCFEATRWHITINHLTKNQNNIFPIETQLREIIKNDKYAYGLVNQGSTYLKDERSYFTALTFYLMIPNENEETSE